jgi:hypothetical protein
VQRGQQLRVGRGGVAHNHRHHQDDGQQDRRQQDDDQTGQASPVRLVSFGGERMTWLWIT